MKDEIKDQEPHADIQMKGGRVKSIRGMVMGVPFFGRPAPGLHWFDRLCVAWALIYMAGDLVWRAAQGGSWAETGLLLTSALFWGHLIRAAWRATR